MNRRVITTADGSKTIHIEGWDEQYHSKHGAIQEAYHVFIEHGLFEIEGKSISILEIGFGTGLNALITLLEADKKSLNIRYTGVEKYPVCNEELRQLNYIESLEIPAYQNLFEQMHLGTWGEMNQLNPNFVLQKLQKDFLEIEEQEAYQLIYFDAFGARVQPNLWTAPIFAKMFNALKPHGVLVTYAAKGSVRRAMQEVGFTVERLPGPPGKREMLRARKLVKS